MIDSSAPPTAPHTAQPLRALVVDDEPLARRHLRNLLADDPEITIIGECGNGAEAVRAIETSGPDIVFLDIQMPELDGFGVLAALDAAFGTSDLSPTDTNAGDVSNSASPRHMPHRHMPHRRMPAMIFVTAFDEYAVKAFDVHALDYVLKPVERDRLLLAVARAKARVRGASQRLDTSSGSSAGSIAGSTVGVSSGAGDVRTLLSAMRPGNGGNAALAQALDRIAVRVDGKHVFLAPGTIDWVEAVDDYVRIHVARTSYLVRATLHAFVNQLPPQFLRIHRSAVVNTERVREVSSTPQGDYRLTLQDGTKLPAGRSYRAAVAEFLRTFSVDSR